MATVYLANQESFDREVALKVMAPALAADKNYGERFMREARIAARFSHPNIIAVYDVGVQGDYYYIAMEYHPGGDLKERLKKNMTTRQAMSILRQIAAALDYAHNKGFIHRDVKPDNILFRDDGSAVLTDFGIARTATGNTQMTQLGMVVGTPKYMSPEQARGQELDSRSDLYSLGIVFYEMLLGYAPFDGNDSIAIGIKHVKEPVPRLPAQLSALQPLVDGMLAKTPEQRYATGRELITDLDQLRLGGLKNQKRDEAIVEDLSAPTEAQVEPTPELISVQPERHDQDGAANNAPHRIRLAKMAGWLLLPLAIGSGYYAWTNVELDKLQQQIRDSQYYQRTLTMVDQWLKADESIPAQASGKQPEAASAMPSSQELSISQLSYRLLGEAISAQALPVHAASSSIATGATAALADLDPDALPIIDMQSRAINQMLSKARSLMVEGQLATPPDDNALQLYQQVLELDQGNLEAEAGQLIIAKHFASLAEKALTTNSLDVAARYLQQAADLAPQLAQLKPLQLQLDQAVTAHQNSVAAARARAAEENNRAQSMLDRFKITGLLRSAEYDVAEDRYTSPADNNALQKYRTVLQVDPANPEAMKGLATIAKKLEIEIEAAAAADDTKKLAKLLAELRLVDPKNPTLQQPSAAP
jgi:serine/threonine protein kinase